MYSKIQDINQQINNLGDLSNIPNSIYLVRTKHLELVVIANNIAEAMGNLLMNKIKNFNVKNQ